MEHNCKQKIASHRVHQACQKPSHETTAICLRSTVDVRQSMCTYITRLPTAFFFECACTILFSRTLSRHFELRKQIGVGGRDKFLPRGWVIGEVNYHTLARNSAFRNMTTKLQAVKAHIHRLTSLSLDFNRLTISSRPPTKERTISPAS